MKSNDDDMGHTQLVADHCEHHPKAVILAMSNRIQCPMPGFKCISTLRILNKPNSCCNIGIIVVPQGLVESRRNQGVPNPGGMKIVD